MGSSLILTCCKLEILLDLSVKEVEVPGTGLAV